MIKINNTEVDLLKPTYFIADIAANHDKDINRAKELIELAKKSGANAAKFQHFEASTIVSDKGFKDLGNKMAHQASWNKTVFDTYKAAELPSIWTEELSTFSNDLGIDFFTSPYDLQIIQNVEPFVCAFKIGSGDITWLESIERMAKFKKPVILATGASDIQDVSRAYESISKFNQDLVIMQCNTNYTNSDDNFNYLNLNVLETYAKMFPNVVLGLSDHTPGHVAVLGAVALGARVIEKHFTDDNNRFGPDHRFSLNPTDWAKMVSDVRTLEKAMGDGKKIIEVNELESLIVQQRSLYYASNLKKGTLLTRSDLSVLRPCPLGAIKPFELINVLGKVLKNDVSFHDSVRWSDLH